jgi:diguanylate cyclase (GGDEF)-like protein
MTGRNRTQGIPESLQDAGTGVLREDAVRWVLSQEVSRAIRYGDVFTLGLVETDSGSRDPSGLRRETLRVVAQALGEELRGTDPIGMLRGGFAIILLSVADQPALNVVGRMWRNVRELRIPRDPPRDVEPITISVGVACFPRHGHLGPTLLTFASECLATARRLGGDRIVSNPTES